MTMLRLCTLLIWALLLFCLSPLESRSQQRHIVAPVTSGSQIVSAVPPAPSSKKQSDGVVLSYEEVSTTSVVEIHHSTLATYAATTLAHIAGKELIVNGNIQPLSCSITELDTAELRVVFDLGEEYRLGKLIGTTAGISVVITGYKGTPDAPGPQVMTTSCTLKAGELAPEQMFRANVKNWYNSIGYFAVRVTSYNGTTVAAVQNNIRLVLWCVAKWKVSGRNYTDALYPASAPALLRTLSPTGNPITENPVTFRWDGISCTPAFPLYQVQILRLYNTSATTTTETDIVAEVDWSEALTVETAQTTLTLTLAEGRGYYQWRVRPIGNYYEGGITNPLNWGEWTPSAPLDATDGKLHLSETNPLPASVFFYEQFDDDKNWIFNRTFTEHAKMSEVMTYANGLQMSEQVQRRMQSQTTKVVQQTLYDYAGRAALSTLPVPYTETAGNAGNAIRYVGRTNLLSHGAGARFSAAQFDRESGGGAIYDPTVVNGGALHSYYNDGDNSNIPPAEGYPYSRTLYYSDGGSRVRETSSPGAAHRMGAGHTSRTLYAAATDQELVRIFGDEAPDAASVAKVVQYDPNTTGTVQYISKEGRVIATALVAGGGNEPLQTLAETEIFASSSGDITDPIIPPKTKNVKSGRVLRAGKTIVLTEPGDVYLDYGLTPKAFHEECMNVCVHCDYRVYFTIYNTADNSIEFQDELIITPGAMEVTSASACFNGEPVTRNGMTVFLNPGSYRVERRLESDNPVAAEKVSYLAWHKQKIAQEVRDRFDALNSGNGLSYVMTTYLSDTSTAPLSQMYDYLNANFQGLKLSIDCGSITIPYYACPQTKCQQGNMDFEQYLKEKVDSSGTLGDKFGTHKAYPGLESWEWGAFNNVIRNMQADGYDCEQLWQCWEAVIEQQAMMNNVDDPEIADAYASANAGQSFNLLDAFLNCTGRRFADTSSNMADYLERPYKYFCPPGPSNGYWKYGDYGDCRGYVAQNYGLNDSAEWEQVYRCWMRGDPPPDFPQNKEDALSELHDSCLSICEYRRAGFRRAVIRAYLEFDPSVDTTAVPVDCIVDSLVNTCNRSCDSLLIGSPIPESVYKNIANFMASGYDLDVSSSAVPACANGYTLIGKREVTPAMLQEKIDVINALLLTYQKLIWENGATPELIATLDSLLPLEIYELIKESPNCANTPHAPPHYVYANRVLYEILTLWEQGHLATSRVQLFLNGCRLEMRTGTHIEMGCVYELDQDVVIYNTPIDSLLSPSPCWVVKVPPISEAIVLCDNMCVWSTGCSICLHWIDPAEITTSIVGNKFEFLPKTCKDDFAPLLRASIHEQLQKIIEERQRRIQDLYISRCMLPDNMLETFSVRYKMRMYHYTLYYYDRAGNLVRTVPPAGVEYVNSRSDKPPHTYVTTYKYNSLKQLVWQSTPDGGVTDFYYNSKTQLRLSRNAKQAVAPQRYSYSKYDELGRPIETGEVQYSSLPSNVDDIGYTSFPTSSHGPLKDITRTYYSTADAGATYLGDGITGQKYLQNRVSYSISDADGNVGTTADQVKTSYSYDPHGNVQWLLQSVPRTETERAVKYLRYEYDLYSGSVVRLLYNERQEDQFLYRYEYDEDNRLQQAATSRDGYIWEVDARYSYFDHGPLKRTVLGEDRVQGLDYTYTIHGWLKGINHASLSATDDPGGDGNAGTNEVVGRDAFGMILNYYQGDFSKSSSAFHSASGSDKLWDGSRPHGGSLYNGNIASWETNIGSTAGGTQYAQRTGHVYRYDLLNRIKDAKFRYHSGGWQAPPNSAYATNYTYDPNGNIKTHVRYAHTGQMDDMEYKYYGTTANPTNRLEYVTDNIPSGAYTEDIDEQSAGNYTYDEIGNMKGDVAEGLTIEWAVNGKVRQVTQGGKTIKFLYDAAGNRVRKEVTGSAIASENATTYYMLDPQGQQLAMYRWSGITTDSVETEYSIYGSDRLGQRRERFNANDRNVLTTAIAFRDDTHNSGWRYTRHIDRQVYELKDHISNGNVRVVVGDIKEAQGTGYVADVKSYANYDAFGMQQPGRCWSGEEYRYGFQGQEKTDELKGKGNHYTAQFWEMDPRLGRRWNLDPKPTIGISDYAILANNPIWNTDVLGDKPTPREAALMAAHVYGNKPDEILEGGWKVSCRDFGIQKYDEKTGLRSQVYERVWKGKKEYVYANAGTQDLTDWIANGLQIIGLSNQHKLSISNAKKISDILKKDIELTFTGHSLGGGEAVANAYTTGRDAITFNAAGLSSLTVKTNNQSKVDSYIMKTDPLNILQNNGIVKFLIPGLKEISLIMPDVDGKRHYVDPPDWSSLFNGHSMDNMLKAFPSNPDKK